jgi:hypothetical protein
MNSFASRFFKLLDSFARSKYRCRLTEMFLNGDESEYVLCFRPLIRHERPETPSSCCYLGIAVKEAMESAHSKLLTQAIAEEMRERPSELNK